jgi:hypothetical protein
MRAVIPYTTDAQANAATKNPQLKLMFRLVHCHVRDEGERASFFCVVLNGSCMQCNGVENFFPTHATQASPLPLPR